jgi:hypothetical protein
MPFDEELPYESVEDRHWVRLLVSELEHRLPRVNIHVCYPRRMLMSMMEHQVYPKWLGETGALPFRGRDITIDAMVEQIYAEWSKIEQKKSSYLFLFPQRYDRMRMVAVHYVTCDIVLWD